MKKNITKGYKPSKKLIKERLLQVIDPSKQDLNYRVAINKVDKHYFSSMENSELVEHLLCDLVKWEYNQSRGGVDARGLINSVFRNIEFKRERPVTSLLAGTMLWSFHNNDSRLRLRGEDLALICSGMIKGKLAYILLIEEVNDTTILDPRKEYSDAKVSKTWNAFKNSKKVHLLYINRGLVKKYATPGFANFLLSKQETFTQIFGFDFRKFLGLSKDTPMLYYGKGGTISPTSTFSSHPTAKTCIEISKSAWDKKIKPTAKKLQSGQFKDLHIGGYVLSLKHENGSYFVKSNIDDTKTKWRPLDLAQQI